MLTCRDEGEGQHFPELGQEHGEVKLPLPSHPVLLIAVTLVLVCVLSPVPANAESVSQSHC